MAKKYLSTKTRTKHTYNFYKERRNAPIWKGDYLRIKAIRQRNLVLGLLIICVIAIVVSFYLVHGNNKIVENRSSIEAEKTKNDDKKQKVQNTEEKDTDQYAEQKTQDPKVIARDFLAKGFTIKAILYNGQDVNDAVNNGDAPPSLVGLDNETVGYLKNDTTIRTRHFATAGDQNITILNDRIKLKYSEYKYTVSSTGEIQFENNEHSIDGETVTYQISSEPDAKDIVDSTPAQN